jgi:uncharacterized repeat protein (TIGR01451 family)
MSYVSSSTTGVITGKEITWSLGSLNPGEKRELSLTLKCEKIGDWTNSVTVTTKEGATDTASATTSVSFVGGMTMTCTDNNDPVEVGEQTTYVITVENQGMIPLHAVKIVNTIPDSTSFVSATGPAKYTVADRTVTFEPVDTVGPGETLTYEVTVKAEAAGAAVNIATLSYEEFALPVTAQEGTTIYGAE